MQDVQSLTGRWRLRYGQHMPEKESSSFLKKRTKKLLCTWRTLPDRTATATKKSFASFLQKRRSCAYTGKAKNVTGTSSRGGLHASVLEDSRYGADRNRITVSFRGYMENLCDYIIAGAGYACCVLASELSRDASARVLLLEGNFKEGGLANAPARAAGRIAAVMTSSEWHSRRAVAA